MERRWSNQTEWKGIDPQAAAEARLRETESLWIPLLDQWEGDRTNVWAEGNQCLPKTWASFLDSAIADEYYRNASWHGEKGEEDDFQSA